MDNLPNKPRFTRRDIVVRTLFMTLCVALVCWSLPHQESFRYEYEVGKPWRYGRLQAPYDFAVYRSDSAVHALEDSIVRSLTPRLLADPDVGTRCLKRTPMLRSKLPGTAYSHLRQRLQSAFDHGILLTADKDHIVAQGHHEVCIRRGSMAVYAPIDSLMSEKEAYAALCADSLYGTLYASCGLRSFIEANLATDTMMMRRDYAKVRQEVSTARSVVLADSRIIDQGEIVTPEIAEVLDSLHREQLNRRNVTGSLALTLLGRIGLTAIILCSVWAFLKLFRPWHYRDTAHALSAVGLITAAVVLTALAYHHLFVSATYLVPIGIVTILLSTFHGSRTAFFCHTTMVLLCSFAVPSHFEYLIIQTVIGIIIVTALKDGLTDRAQLMQVSLLSMLGYIGLYVLFTLANEGTLARMPGMTVAMMVANSLLLLMSYLIIYGMERTLGFVSGVTLVELCNVGKGVLLQLQQDAPGTYNHAMQVANIAAAAAKAVDANPALVRTGALYHDIGKLWAPQYYTENLAEGTPSPHKGLPYTESAALIMRHVTEGVALARRHKLPKEIADFITTHHGRSRTQAFYIQWCNEHPDQQPDEALFTYPGPDPESKEQAILMMADAVEASCRSLRVYNHDTIAAQVNKIVDGQVMAGRFNAAKITLHEIQICKLSLIRSVEGIYHGRISYPELSEQAKANQAQAPAAPTTAAEAPAGGNHTA